MWLKGLLTANKIIMQTSVHGYNNNINKLCCWIGYDMHKIVLTLIFYHKWLNRFQLKEKEDKK